MGEVVLPGELLQNEHVAKASVKNKLILGPGLKRRGHDVVVCQPGLLRHRPPATYWVDCLEKSYVPKRDETVVGVVTKKMGDYFKVDIRAADQALLHFLSFEGATKKYRPEVNVGDAIFGRLVLSSTDMEPELVCINSLGKKENLGVLPTQNGFLFRISLHLVRKLLNPDCPLLPSLGRYESAIGMNGVVWIRGETIAETVHVANLLLSAETMSSNEIKRLVAPKV